MPYSDQRLDKRQRGIGNTNAVKLARCIVALEEFYGIGHGGNRKSSSDNLNLKNQQDLANEIGMNKNHMIAYKKLLDLIPELQSLIETGEMSPTVGYKVWARLPQEEQIRILLGYCP